MAKHIPLFCSAENCGDNYPVCGKKSTYERCKCRCDSCAQATSEYMRKRYRDNEKDSQYRRAKYVANRNVILKQRRDYRKANREEAAERDRRFYVANREKLFHSQWSSYNSGSRITPTAVICAWMVALAVPIMLST